MGERVTDQDRRDVAAWLTREADQRVEFFPQRRDGIDALMRSLAADLTTPSRGDETTPGVGRGGDDRGTLNP